uniref:Uncharacterized protein n=1 Tax=uncultured bacterium esnapd21 TaxID=1366603 RepID=S5UBV4_9BACT|nr:hypothetical protein [uncultured bacterium esnapd21]
MKTLAWTLLVCGGLVWSGLAWIAWRGVDWATDIAARNPNFLTADPETVIWLSSAAGLLAASGQAGVLAIWLVGLAILGVLAILLLTFENRTTPKHLNSKPSHLRTPISDRFLRSRRHLPFRGPYRGVG